MPQSSNLVFHAIALERRLLSKEALDKALEEAERRGRPIERHLVETGVLASDVSRTVEVARAKQARACTACRKLTYIAPNGDLAALPCEHCGGVLAPPAPPPAPLPGRGQPPAASAGPTSGSQVRPVGPGSTSGAGSTPGSSTTSVKVAGSQGSTLDSSPGQATPRGAFPRPAPGTTTPRGGSMPRPAPGTTTPRSGSMPRPGAPPGAPAGAQAQVPAPKSGPQPKPPAPAQPPAQANPRSGAQPKPAQAPAPAPKSGPQPKPAPVPEAPAPAPAGPEADAEEGIPTWIGPCRVEAELGADDTVVIYAARVGEERCAVRLLQPRLATSRRHVDAFFRSCQKAAVVGLEPLEVGLDERGAPFLAVKRTDDEDDPATALLALQAPDAASESSGHGSTSSDSNDALVFAQLNKQREQLQRQVAEASKRRDRVVGSFVLLEKLGRDLGELWRGYDTGKNELCAVRVVDGFEPLTESGRLRKDLDDPLGAAQRLRHPNLVPPRDRGLDRGKLFVVRELGNARPLLGGQSIQHVARAAMGAAQALAYLHGQGLAHGGLHPGVVLVDGNGRGLLVDPALAAVAAAAQALGPAWRLARVGCAAPESEGGVDGQAGDLHALGAVLYRAWAEWLPETLAPPGAPGPNGAVAADPPNDALAVALRCLEKDPAARYASATDLATDLGRIVQGQVPAARTPRPAPAAPAAPKASGQVVERLTGMFKKLGKALGRDGSS